MQNGERIDPSQYQYAPVIAASSLQITSDEKVTSALRAGASIVLDEVEDLHLPLRDLATSLQTLFTAYVNVNLYAGFKHEPGFLVHWDKTDAFILQIAGRKSWQVWLPTRRWPVRADHGRLEQPKGEPIWRGDLTAGDVLYLPRGWWHVAIPVDEPSLHVTVTVNTRLGVDVARWLVGRLADHDVARRNIPSLAPAEDQEEYYRELAEAVMATAASGDLRKYLEAERESERLRPRPVFRLPNL
jgi:ribosomal protein L16 Arg81 hydroxylase